MSDLKYLEKEVNCGDTLMFLTALRACEQDFEKKWNCMAHVDQVSHIVTWISGYKAGRSR